MSDEFSRFLHESDYETQEDIMGLTILYRENNGEGIVETETQDVRELLRLSRISVNIDAVPARLSDLEDSGLLTVVDSSARVNSYRLTFEGLEKFEEMAPEMEESDKVRDDLFIDTDNVEIDYYSKLVSHINLSYQYGVNDGCLVLTRKLFENFIIDIFRAEYGGQEIDLYFNTEKGRFHGLGTLCGNLRDKSSDLKHYSRKLDNGLVDRIEHFKERGNAQAHSVRVDIDTGELEVMSEEATELAETLYDIREEVRIANG